MKRTSGMVLAATLALAGCSTLQSTAETVGDWFSWSDSSAAKPSPLVELAPGPQPREVWRTDAGDPKASLFQPAANGEAVFAAGAKAGFRFSLDTGKTAWRAESPAALSAGVGLGPELLLAGTVRGELIALDVATGAARWSAKLTSELAGVPLQAGDVVIARSGDGLLRGLSAATGERVWQYSRSLPPLALRGSGGMSVGAGQLYAGFPGGKLVALDAAKGTQLWEATVALPRGATEIERIADVMGAPLVDARRVCAAAYQGSVACFDRASGAPLWSRDASTHVALAADDAHLYHVGADDVLTQHDLDSGRAGWRQDKLAHRRLSAPLVFERWLVVGDAEGYVHVLSLEDGSLVARTRVDGAIVAAPINLGPGFAVQTVKGGVTAFKIQ